MTHRDEPGSQPQPTAKARDAVPLLEASRTWTHIALQTFGGPAGQIAVMQRILVDEKRWIGQLRFNHALSFCMVLPGPEAQQLATYIGWLLNGVRGGLIAGVLFILPGAAALLALSAVYVGWGDSTVVTGLFVGLAPAVLAIVSQALIRISRRSLRHPALIGIAATAFLVLTALAAPFPLVVAAAALAGLVLHHLRPDALPATQFEDDRNGSPPLVADGDLHAKVPDRRWAVKVTVVGLAVWALPVVAVIVFTGVGSVFTSESLFFSGTALVTFGGAYAVLSFVAYHAVQTFGWLGSGEMVKGLALAETTPGPLIMVVQFVAFLGAYRNPGELNPWVAAVLGALLVTWVTFAPCFLFIFLGAPYVERLRSNRAVSAALTGIMAAVVGVIGNLTCYFTTNTLFGNVRLLSWGPIELSAPVLGTIQPAAVALTVLAFGMIFGMKWTILRTLAASAGLGLAGTVAMQLL